MAFGDEGASIWVISTMNDSKILTRRDILGARIQEIYQTYEMLDGWLDCTQTYFALDRGQMIIHTPWVGQVWSSEELPTSARIVEHQSVQSIKGKAIVGVYCDLSEGKVERHPSSIKFLLDDGRWLWTCDVAPHGVGGAGLFVDEPNIHNVDQMMEFWRIPLEKDKTQGREDDQEKIAAHSSR